MQIDFDCAESKLEGYGGWVRSIRQRIAPVPLVITALPSWLNRREFGTLAEAAGYAIVQVGTRDRAIELAKRFLAVVGDATGEVRLVPA